MTVNVYVKKWCEEDYDIRKEDFYVENAYYVAGREWASSGWKHGVMSLVIAYFVGYIGFCCDNPRCVLDALVTLGIFTVSYWLYGIRNFNANSPETGLIVYGMTLLFLFITKGKVSVATQILFAIPSCILFVFLAIVNPIKFSKVASHIKERMAQEEQEEARESTKRYSKWESQYKAFRYGLPESEQKVPDNDPNMVEARNLFAGYSNDKQMLKARYRQLAKQYHPDRGGDTKLFQCIIEVYEELNRIIF